MNNLLPGIPLVESPLFPTIFPTLALNDEEARVGLELHHRGFAAIDFPDDMLDERIARIKANLAPRFGVDFTDPDSDKLVGDQRIQDAWRFDEDVRAIAANDAVLTLLRKLYGREAFPFQTLNFPVGTQQAAHSDMVHFSSQPEKFMCGVWLAMEDVVPESGPLFYYPGSHRWPVMSNALIGRIGARELIDSAQHPFEQAWTALIEATGSQPETFIARKGQALIWTANLLHGGSPQIDPRLTRWSQVTHYYFDDCFYYTPAFSDEALGHFDLRTIHAINDGQLRPNRFLGALLSDRKVSKVGRSRSLVPAWLKR